MILEGYMKDRRDRRRTASQEGRKPENSGADRLIEFDRWARTALETRLDWSWAGEQREKRIHQFRIELERVVFELWQRGWLLDGRALAAHLRTLLDAVGAAQRAGKVQDHWSYFRASVSRYVGANAEELKAEAIGLGAHVSQQLAKLQKSAPALPELVAQRRGETLREAQSRRRAEKARNEAEKAQLPLW